MRLCRLVLVVSPMLAFVAFVAFVASGGAVTAQPQLPSTVYGSVAIDGQTVPDGTGVRGFIDGVDCTQLAGLRGTVVDGGVSAFVVNVMHESQQPGCGKDGKTVTFTVGGRPAPQVIAWKTGLQRFDLNVGAGLPLPLPSATSGPAIGAATPAAVPTGPLPTDDVTFSRTPAPRPTVPARADEVGEGGGRPVVVVLAAGIGLLAAIGAMAGFVLSRRTR